MMKTIRHLSTEDISANVDNSIEMSAITRKHLSSCLECQERLFELKSIISAINYLPRVKADPGFSLEVMSRLKEADTGWCGSINRIGSHYLKRTYYAAVAATVVLGVSLSMFIFHGGNNNEQMQTTYNLSYLDTFAPLPLSYPCDDYESCNPQENTI